MTDDNELKDLVARLRAPVLADVHPLSIHAKVMADAADALEALMAERDVLSEQYDALLKNARALEARAERAEAALERARNGIAVLGDTTKHLGLQAGQDRAAGMVAEIDAILKEAGYE